MPADRSHLPPLNPSVAGVVLAAGSSTRMGRNKLLFELDGETVAHQAVRRALAAGLDPVVVVVGYEADRVRAALETLDCRCVVNPAPEEGTSSSVRTGIAALPATAGAAVVLLADMPFVTEQMIASLVTRYHESHAALVVSRYGDVNAPPMLYDRVLFAELETMTGEGCGRQVVRRHLGEAAVLEWPSSALADLDTPDDYDRVRARLAAG